MSKSSERLTVNVPGLPDSGRYGYEQCVVSGGFVFVAGQVGVDEHFDVVPGGIVEQTEQTFRNVSLALTAAGCQLRDIISMTVFLTHLREDFHQFIEVRQRLLGGGSFPTSAVIGVSELAHPDLRVEIQAIAARSAQVGDSER